MRYAIYGGDRGGTGCVYYMLSNTAFYYCILSNTKASTACHRGPWRPIHPPCLSHPHAITAHGARCTRRCLPHPWHRTPCHRGPWRPMHPPLPSAPVVPLTMPSWLSCIVWKRKRNVFGGQSKLFRRKSVAGCPGLCPDADVMMSLHSEYHHKCLQFVHR